MKYLILFVLLCTSCWTLTTNIDEHVAEQFACRIHELTVQEKLEWETKSSLSKFSTSKFSTTFKGKYIFISEDHIHMVLDYTIPVVIIRNPCQKMLYKYLDDKYQGTHEKKIRTIQENYFNEALKSDEQT